MLQRAGIAGEMRKMAGLGAGCVPQKLFTVSMAIVCFPWTSATRTFSRGVLDLSGTWSRRLLLAIFTQQITAAGLTPHCAILLLTMGSRYNINALLLKGYSLIKSCR